MKHVLTLLTLSLLLFACTSEPPANTENEGTENQTTTTVVKPDFTIKPGEGFGGFGEEMEKAEFEEILKPEEWTERDFYIGEGESAPGLVLYPDTPEEVEVLLDDDGYSILYRLAKTDSKWATAEGISVGSTMQELEAANGKPFKFSGFDWDYGGTVTNWNGGAFDGKGLLVVLEPDYENDPIKESDMSALVGDQEVMSDSPAAQRYTFTVVEIMQRY